MAIATTPLTRADVLFETALEEIAAGESRAASGSLWNATAEAFEALAKRRGWVVNKHMRYDDVCDYVEPELTESTLSDGMAAAVLMESNWLDDYELSEAWLRDCAEDIRKMIDALQSV